MTHSAFAIATQECCDRFGLTFEELSSRRKYPRIVRARQWLWWVLHDKYGVSYPEIGRTMLYDHSTVIYGARKAKREHEAAA